MIIIYHERKETEGGEEEELGRKEDNKHIVVALPNELSNHNSRSIGNKAKYEKTEREKERKRDLTETYWPIGSVALRRESRSPFWAFRLPSFYTFFLCFFSFLFLFDSLSRVCA